MKKERVTEDQVRHEILRLLTDGKVWTNAQLKKKLRLILPLSPADKERATHRVNEEKWEELVNNALSQSRPKSLPGQGFTDNLRRGEHRITEKGREAFKYAEDFYDALAGKRDFEINFEIKLK